MTRDMDEQDRYSKEGVAEGQEERGEIAPGKVAHLVLGLLGGLVAGLAVSAGAIGVYDWLGISAAEQFGIAVFATPVALVLCIIVGLFFGLASRTPWRALARGFTAALVAAVIVYGLVYVLEVTL